jgi:hypothetical protein
VTLERINTDEMGDVHDAGMSERLIQRDNRAWRVREVAARTVPGSRGPRCLICESAEVVRRLWHYPDDWQHLDDAVLWELCEAPLL